MFSTMSDPPGDSGISMNAGSFGPLTVGGGPIEGRKDDNIMKNPTIESNNLNPGLPRRSSAVKLEPDGCITLTVGPECTNNIIEIKGFNLGKEAKLSVTPGEKGGVILSVEDETEDKDSNAKGFKRLLKKTKKKNKGFKDEHEELQMEFAANAKQDQSQDEATGTCENEAFDETDDIERDKSEDKNKKGRMSKKFGKAGETVDKGSEIEGKKKERKEHMNSSVKKGVSKARDYTDSGTSRLNSMETKTKRRKMTTKKIACRSLAAAGISIILIAIPLTMTGIGGAHLNECQRKRLIPIHLIIAGIVSCLTLLMLTFYILVVHDLYKSWIDVDDTDKGKKLKCSRIVCVYRILLGLGLLFTLGWTIVGAWAAYSVYGSVQFSDPSDKNYCHRVTYFLIFGLLKVAFLVFIISIIGVVIYKLRKKFAAVRCCCKERYKDMTSL